MLEALDALREAQPESIPEEVMEEWLNGDDQEARIDAMNLYIDLRSTLYCLRKAIRLIDRLPLRARGVIETFEVDASAREQILALAGELRETPEIMDQVRCVARHPHLVHMLDEVFQQMMSEVERSAEA